jgi:hypothetical protein
MRNQTNEQKDFRLKNKIAINAVTRDNVSLMENIFKTIGVEQDAIDHLIFSVSSVKMMKLFRREGGDIHKLGPPLHPHPRSLIYECSIRLKDRKDSELVKLFKFLITEGADVNLTYEDGETAFSNCARHDQLELCKLLVDRGADPFVVRILDKFTALHAAAINGHISVCRYLVDDCGLDIDAMTSNLQTPLYIATLEGRIEACTYLLEKGAKVDAGDQPLTLAALVLSTLIALVWPFKYIPATFGSWSESLFSGRRGNKRALYLLPKRSR